MGCCLISQAATCEETREKSEVEGDDCVYDDVSVPSWARSRTPRLKFSNPNLRVVSVPLPVTRSALSGGGPHRSLKADVITWGKCQ